jgi:hypothetical protein
MPTKPLDVLLPLLLVLGAMVTFSGSAWAASGDCSYAKSSTDTGGSGMGGTGDVAKGTGMGGTGIKLGIYMNEMKIAGNVIFSKGAVEAQRNGHSRILVKGDPVCSEDTIITAQSGWVKFKMTDGNLLSVRPGSQLKIEKYVYNGTGKDSNSLILLKGSSHLVTRKSTKQFATEVMLKTPTATIGMREADYEATVILPGESGRYAAGTYDKVNTGRTFIKTEKGEVDIYQNQVGYAASGAELPILLDEIPDFYNTNPFVQLDDSAGQGAGTEGDRAKDK